MRRRITITSPQSVPEEVAFDSWLPGQGLLQESIALAGIIFVAGEIIVLGVAYLAVPLADAVLFTLAAAPVMAALAALIALALAVYRVLRFERRERRHIALLDARVEEAWRWLEPPVAEETAGSGRVARDDLRYWDRLAYEVLRRYYTVLDRTGDPARAVQAISRRACVGDGLCTQGDWNELNRLLQARGIRGKRRLRPTTFEEAWRMWQEGERKKGGWYVREDGVWVPKE